MACLIPLPCGRHRIGTLPVLLALLLGTGTGLAADPGRIVVLGDSIAAGYGVEVDQAYPALLEEKIRERGWPFVVSNAGVSGDTTAGGLRRVDWLLKRPAAVLVIELGGNDGLRGVPPAETRSNLLGIIERARARQPGIRILLAGMQMPRNMGADYLAEFREVFPAVARKTGVALVPHLLEGVGADPELNQPDLIHPNPAGHRRVTENVWAHLEPLLAELMAARSTPE